MKNQKDKVWDQSPVEVVEKKHMIIVGYGDIGSACAKIAKNGFGMRVTGFKRNPLQVSE